MRTALIVGSILVTLSLGACGVAGSTDATPAVGAVVVTPSGAVVAASCLGVAPRVAGRLITVEDVKPAGQVLVFADGVPLCQDTLAGVCAAGVLTVAAPPSGPGSPSRSDPMPAHGGGGDDKTGGGGGGNGGGGGGSMPTGGDGNSDPMPADDTRRN